MKKIFSLILGTILTIAGSISIIYSIYSGYERYMLGNIFKQGYVASGFYYFGNISYFDNEKYEAYLCEKFPSTLLPSGETIPCGVSIQNGSIHEPSLDIFVLIPLCIYLIIGIIFIKYSMFLLRNHKLNH